MEKTNTIAVFDIGKTNKKLLLFDEDYHLLHEESQPLEETRDEDGFPCEDIQALTSWIKNSFDKVRKKDKYSIRALNFSAYGASFVLLDEKERHLAPIYNYLKPYPESLSRKFYEKYGGQSILTQETASPVLGSLNSGLQLYRLKNERPEIFQKLKYALHLPQYLSYLFTQKACSDLTSVGCHTHLWDFHKQRYHRWVIEEGIEPKLAPIKSSATVGLYQNDLHVGIGLHDSSAALVPYLFSFTEPFLLLSTGTWNIALNPYNQSPLTEEELQQDCLCYLSYKGQPVKASRLFAGYEHKEYIRKIAAQFQQPEEEYKKIEFDPSMVSRELNLSECKSYAAAYHGLIVQIIQKQVKSINVVLKGSPVKRFFVDGGFSNNPIFMNLLSAAYPQIEVRSANVHQATALGAALVMHDHWNNNVMPQKIIETILLR
jgi:sugar (pentulose or hexulose) kinase